MKTLLSLILCAMAVHSSAQSASITGTVYAHNAPVAFATVSLSKPNQATVTDSLGSFYFKDLTAGNYKLQVSHAGFHLFETAIRLSLNEPYHIKIMLSPNDTLTEVVVTGLSKATLIRENPVAIVAISQKQIQQTAGPNIIDVLAKNAPGVSVVKTGPNVSKPFIRGLGYNRVLTLYNGIRQEGQQWGDEHGIEVDPYNIERAEIIKGPASLMFGTDALAGVVSMFSYIPRAADSTLHGSFATEYQSNNNLVGNSLRLDYSTRRFFFSLAGSYRVAKNYRNKVDGRVYNTGFDEKNLSAAAGFVNKNGFSRLGFTLYDNRQGIPDGSRDSLSRRFTKQVNEGEADIIQDRPLVTEDELKSYKLSPLHQHIQHYRIYSHNQYQLGAGNIDINLAAQQNIRKEYNHPTAIQQAGMYVKLNTLNYNLRYNAPSFNNIETSIGLNGMLQKNENLDATDFPIPDYSLSDGGAFIYAKWKAGKWTLGGGLRYDMRKVSWGDFYILNNPETGFNKHSLQEVSGATLQFSTYTKIFQGLSASTGVTYQATDQISLKANIGRAYRAPNITEIASNGLDPGAHIIYLGNRNFESEFSLQEDIGISGRFENFSADLSFFNNNIQNYIYQSMEVDAAGNPVVDPQGNRTYKYQQGKAQLYGAEAWLALHPQKINGLQWSNSLALVYGFNRNAAFKDARINGAYLPLIPPATLTSNLSKKTALHSETFVSITPMIEVAHSFAQERYFGYNNTETLTPAYTLLNCGIQTEIKYARQKTLDIQIQATNLLNTVYQSHLSRLKYFEYFSQSPDGRLGMYDMGRSVNLKVILPF